MEKNRNKKKNIIKIKTLKTLQKEKEINTKNQIKQWHTLTHCHIITTGYKTMTIYK